MVTRDVFVPISGGEGGAAIGGDSGTLGFWTTETVEETYYVDVQVGTREETYSVRVQVGTQPESYQAYEQVGTREETYFVSEVVGTREEEYMQRVLSHYEDVQEPYRRLSHYDEVERQRWVREYENQQYEVTRQRRHERQLVSSNDVQAPANGIIFADGPIKFMSGEIVERLTIATEADMRITGNVQYVDGDGDTAYINGENPALPYRANSNYENDATLGMIARHDVIYGREVPFNFEINGAILSIEGRVGVEGIELDSDGEVTSFNQLVDQWGEPTSGEFVKNSIRRLGGVVTAHRPLDTVVSGGRMRAGFGVGTSVFDESLINAPPPDFLTREVPRFFAINIER